MPELPPHYYRDNFLQLLDTVAAQYDDILTKDEQGFLTVYRQLPFDAQCLYVRLVSRVGPWFRESSLQYPELGPIEPAVSALLDTGMAVQPQCLSAEELGRLCTRDEVAAMLGLGVSGKRALLATATEQDLQCLPALLALDSKRVLAPAHLPVVELMQLLFFGNRYQGMTDFVLSDLGVAKYFPYSLDRSRRLFPGRPELEEYLGCAQCADRWQEIQETGDAPAMLQLAGELLAEPPQYATSQRRWYRLCNSLARQLEREGHVHQAMALYRVNNLHPARERLARLLERDGDYSESLALCKSIEDNPWCEEERDAARRIQPRLQRKLEGAKIQRQRDCFAETQLLLPPSDLGVEAQVAQSLAGQWQGVHYVENLLMNTMFGLAFWEQIFAPVAGAFNNPFQSVPADMYEQNFRSSRQVHIEARLEQLAEVNLAEELARCWHDYYGYQCRWINWKYLDETLVSAAAAVIPKQHLLAIWQRMLFDPRENRRGFPDLLALGNNPGEYQMIEVKGPGDALQESQKRWLRFFQKQQIPASIAWVRWADA